MSTAIILGAICKQPYHMAVAMAVTSKCESNSTDMASVSFVKVNKNTDELELSYK